MASTAVKRCSSVQWQHREMLLCAAVSRSRLPGHRFASAVMQALTALNSGAHLRCDSEAAEARMLAACRDTSKCSNLP